MNFYDRLVQETAGARQQLYAVPQLANALRGDISVETYRAYLIQAYHHVKHTVRFLMAMGVRLPEEHRWLHHAIVEYLEEEIGHEEWILNDIAATGGDKEAARLSTPHLETEVLVAYNYDYINRRNPVGFLGMVFMLESTSTQIAAQGANSIQQTLGLPAEAFTYLQSHGKLDISHMQFFRQLVNHIDDPLDQAAIIEVARNTFRLFANVLASILVGEEMKHAA
ncbi:iron-containing redox enzyme family protein [Candidatus Thiothrix sp. Deng01]|uniref:Iron-containing redox enzyme family protein n=1 Tax=Candidatus Thiothrix phosphatis TaxID=3112415 RepID=A0ABU6CV01_9GAMM|nr:iron-containing redox enzyme family protein [Candidatus Thiothrix sp. Deng01]MEB4590638.1 iron-containing redox enzyme family protein [Candidatus Thiothrix sp. Deng01]